MINLNFLSLNRAPHISLLPHLLDDGFIYPIKNNFTNNKYLKDIKETNINYIKTLIL